MNKLLLTLFGLVLAFFQPVFGQNVPSAIPYQAVIRDAAGQILASQNVTMRFSILKDGPTGAVVFQETQASFSSQFGVIAPTIGFGSATVGSLAAVDWSAGNHFLKVEMNAGAGFKDLGTTQFLSVPYALFAGKVAGGGGSGGSSIFDANANTGIETEKYPDEDLIRVQVDGLERWEFRNSALEPKNSGKSIFIGEDAGISTVPNGDKENVFVGHHAGKLNSTGFYGTFVGSGAGSNNDVSGESNTFIGAHSGFVNSSGYVNVFIGEATGYGNKTGAANTFVGQLAGFNNDNGAYNTFIGRGSGKANVGGQHNTYLGRSAGFNNVNGSFNVFIGDLGGFKETAVDRTLIIETDTSANAAGPLIYGSFQNRKVGLNRKATTNTLEVGGDASKNTPGSWLGNSDLRLKKSVEPLNAQDILQKMLALRGVTFEWNDEKTGIARPKGRQTGFIAQDIEAVFPEKVSRDAQGFLQTAYSDFDPMMLEAIRALNQKIEVLEAQNVELLKLKAEVEALKKR